MAGIVDAGRDAAAAVEVASKVEGVTKVDARLASMAQTGSRLLADG